MTVCELRGHLQESYGVEVPTGLIRRVTDAVLGKVLDQEPRSAALALNPP